MNEIDWDWVVAEVFHDMAPCVGMNKKQSKCFVCGRESSGDCIMTGHDIPNKFPAGTPPSWVMSYLRAREAARD